MSTQFFFFFLIIFKNKFFIKCKRWSIGIYSSIDIIFTIQIIIILSRVHDWIIYFENNTGNTIKKKATLS